MTLLFPRANNQMSAKTNEECDKRLKNYGFLKNFSFPIDGNINSGNISYAFSPTELATALVVWSEDPFSLRQHKTANNISYRQRNTISRCSLLFLS